jgi:hypothetical protein
MIFLPKIYRTVFVTLLLTLACHIVLAAGQSSTPTVSHLTGYVEYETTEGGFFGIVGDDGQKYQPTNLPHKVRTNGLPIKFDAVINDNIISTFMWGKIIDVSNVAPLTTKISNNERSALYVLLKRMDAFNRKDLVALQQIDTLAEQLTTTQFNDWIDNYGNYTLQYVELSTTDVDSLTGTCYYTREFLGGTKVTGNLELAATTFTISQTNTGWKLTALNTLQGLPSIDPATLLTDLKQKALEKYKTDQLATLLQ